MSYLSSSSLCCWYFCHLFFSFSPPPSVPSTLLFVSSLSSPLFRWARQQGSKSRRQSSALVSLFRKHWVMLMQAQPMALNLFTHVIKLYNVVIVDIHGVEVYFLQSSMQFPGGTSSKPMMWQTWGTGWPRSTKPAKSLWVPQTFISYTHTPVISWSDVCCLTRG